FPISAPSSICAVGWITATFCPLSWFCRQRLCWGEELLSRKPMHAPWEEREPARIARLAFAQPACRAFAVSLAGGLLPLRLFTVGPKAGLALTIGQDRLRSAPPRCQPGHSIPPTFCVRAISAAVGKSDGMDIGGNYTADSWAPISPALWAALSTH